jgi:putative flavoprotein involved in K+ transport
MGAVTRTERFETLIIGGGQAGLATGYHMARRGLPFAILEAGDRIGDVWRRRWDSLRLFTPARYDALPGMPFPASPHYFPRKDEFADYLESYAQRFELPVRTGVEVRRLARQDGRFVVTTAEGRYEADNVIVAMGNHQVPWTPAYANDLDPDIVQLHSAHYRNAGQLQPGAVLLVGAGNSGSEIAMELAPRHRVLMSGRNTGEIPFRPSRLPGRLFLVPLVLRFLFYRVLTVDTPIGRAARPKIIGRGGPLIRVKNRDLAAAGVQRVARTVGVKDGRPLLAGGEVPAVRNVVWCTGYRPGFESWINLPIHGEHEPRHERGVVPGQPGLFFVGLHFQRALSSEMIHGVGRDAEEIVRAVERRVLGGSRSVSATSGSTRPATKPVAAS